MSTYELCDACAGSGTDDDHAACCVCGGSGRVDVVKPFQSEIDKLYKHDARDAWDD